MTTIIPLKKKILVAENKRENTTESGIVIQGADRHGESRNATVLAVGPNVDSEDVKVGDTVYLMWNKAQVVTVHGAQRAIVDIEDVVAVLEK